MYCKKCGKQIDDDSVFCVYCGCQLISQPTPEEQTKTVDEQGPVTEQFNNSQEPNSNFEGPIPTNQPKTIGGWFKFCYRIFAAYAICDSIASIINNLEVFSFQMDSSTKSLVAIVYILQILAIIFLGLSMANIKKYYKYNFIIAIFSFVASFFHTVFYLEVPNYGFAFMAFYNLSIYFLMHLYLKDRVDE